MPQLDPATFAPQLVWLAITFVLLYGLMAWVALPRIGRMIDQRSARIESDLAEAQRIRAEAEAVHAAYERSLAEARAEAQAALRQAVENLTQEAVQRQRAASAKLEAETEAAEARIAVARNAALANVRTVAIEVARAATTRLIGGEADDVRIGDAVDAALKERA